LALIVWQAIGLCTGMAAIGAGLHFGLTSAAFSWLRIAAITVAAALAGYLLIVAAWVTASTLTRRRRHRAVLDLVGTPIPSVPGGRVLESSAAMAYCLPGLRPRMVVTTAALTDLSPGAFDAVVAHELSHLRQRHDLVVLPFVAWQAALPFLPSARTARASVALLIEALADDTARARVGDRALDEALSVVRLTDEDEPGADLAVRVRRGRLAPL
jgi:Zn-dependent protease with chaperone function